MIYSSKRFARAVTQFGASLALTFSIIIALLPYGTYATAGTTVFLILGNIYAFTIAGLKPFGTGAFSGQACLTSTTLVSAHAAVLGITG